MIEPAPGRPAERVVPPVSLGRPGRMLATVAGLMIMAMMFVTTIDVVGRYFFNRPLFGAFEVTEILMGLVIFAGLPLATAAREHIVVNLLESALSRRTLCVQAAMSDGVCALISGVMAWRIFLRGSGLVESREVTLVLGVNRGWIAWGMALLLAATACVFVYTAIVAARAARHDRRA